MCNKRLRVALWLAIRVELVFRRAFTIWESITRSKKTYAAKAGSSCSSERGRPTQKAPTKKRGIWKDFDLSDSQNWDGTQTRLLTESQARGKLFNISVLQPKNQFV
jgi:hypothetical protein